MSRERKDRAKKNNALAGAAAGAIIGLAINPVAALCGLGIGALIGHSADPET